jgi:fucose permease
VNPDSAAKAVEALDCAQIVATPVVAAEATTVSVSEQAAPAAPAPAPAPVVVIDAAAAAQFERDKWITVVIAAALLGVYVGAETGYAAYVTAFSVIELGSTEARGQWLTSIFWAAITAGRFASIWLSAALSPGTFLRLSMGVSALSSLILIGAARSEGGLWFFSVVFGLAMAPVFPTVLSLVESYFPVLGKYATVLMIGSAGGEMVIPAIIASSFGGAAEEAATADGAASGAAANPRALLFIVAAACSVNFGALFVLQRQGAQAARNHAALK